MIRQIFHIADIHIHERNYAHIEYAWAGLMKTICSWPNYKQAIVLVIAGDIFDHKTWLSAGDISLFNRMIGELETREIRTIMMPGNHDYNINADSADKVAALMESRSSSRFVTHFSKSAIVVHSNIAFFIHSPIDRGAPRPGADHVGLKKVAMVHEPITGAKTTSGVTFREQRWRAGDFAKSFDMTMLGDIHMPQLLAPNVAYSGSFVQKNKGEDLAHGFMRWDVTTNVPTFVELDQLSLWLKISVTNDIMPILPKVKARSLTLLHAKCTVAWVDTLAETMRAKYEIKAIDILNKDVVIVPERKADEVADAERAGVRKTNTHELGLLVGAMLRDQNVPAAQHDRILTLHRQYFESTPGSDIKDWKLRFVSWSRIGCYEDNNWINFDSLTGITSIIGPNGTGKSLIIDLIVLGLFNETVRGSKRYALNITAQRGHIKCVFSVGADVYAIERAWLSTTHVVARLYKNGVNISGPDILATYRAIEALIGSKRLFIHSAAAMQHRQFLVDISSKDRYELLSRMLDLDRLRTIEDENKSTLRTLKKEIAELEGRASAEHEAGLSAKRSALATQRQIFAKTQAQLAEVGNRKLLIAPDAAMPANYSLAELSAKYNMLERYANYDGDKEIESYTRSLAKAEPKLAEVTNRFQLANGRVAELSRIRSAMTGQPNNLPGIEAQLENIVNLDAKVLIAQLAELSAEHARIGPIKAGQWTTKRAIASIEAEISMLPDDSALAGQLAIANENLAAKNADVDTYRKLANGVEGKRTDVMTDSALASAKARQTEIEAELGRLTQSAIAPLTKIALTWNGECATCSANRKAFSTLAVGDTAKQILVLERELSAIRESVTRHFAGMLCLHRDGHRLALQAIAKIDKDRALRGALVGELADAKARDAYEVVAKRATVVASELADVKRKIELVSAQDKLRIDRDAALEAKRVDAELLSARALADDLAEQMAKGSRIIADLQQKLAGLKTWRDKAAELEAIKEKYELAQMAEATQEEMRELDADLARLTLKMQNELEAIAGLSRDVGALEAKVAASQTDAAILSAKRTTYADIELYDKIINHKTGIPDKMISDICARIQTQSNHFLANIADFELRITFDGEVHVDIIRASDASNPAADTVSADLASGYQKFIIDLVMRQSLCSLAGCAKAGVLFIDEGFGSADEENLAIICRKVLPTLARSFEKVIIISHLTCIHEYANSACEIVRGGSPIASRLQVGEAPADWIELRVLADHAEYTKALAVERLAQKADESSAKSIKAEKKKADDEAKAREKIETYSTIMFEQLADPKKIRCVVCNKEYRKIEGFSAKHTKTAGHMKALLTWEPAK